MTYVEESYIGTGIPYIDGVDAGNASGIKLGINYDEKSQKNHRTVAGGTLNKYSKIESVSVEITFTDFSADHLARGLRGLSSAVTAGAVADESISAPSSLTGDPLVETEFMIDTAETVTVTTDPATPDPPGTTYTVDTDYEVTAAGIKILEGGSISASAALLIDYTKEATSVIEALTGADTDYRFVFDGRNAAQGGKPFVVKIHKLKFSPMDELDLVGDEFGAFTLKGEALLDSTYNGTTKSQYFVVDKAA